MGDFFEIDGYWKDTKESFEKLIVYEYNNEPEETAPYSDDDIFYYGLGENDLAQVVNDAKNTIWDFVITSYTKIIQ